MKNKLTKQEFNKLLKESINEVMLEEGFFDNVKSFGKNLKRGYDSFSRNYDKSNDNDKEDGVTKFGKAFNKAKQTWKHSDRYEKLENLSKTIKEYVNKGLIFGKGKEAANSFVITLLQTINSMKSHASASAGREKGETFKDMDYGYNKHFNK